MLDFIAKLDYIFKPGSFNCHTSLSGTYKIDLLHKFMLTFNN